ncbi:hypothetical protein Q5P01_023921 [Channa striata]|uniref:Trichohyalin-plectin-homology domain-containing protein n=1 Tax=Channa striata TaxID=64152 RepID=A0AA88IXA3_CHASR|nr:hypothetical protein Q5P01_023921 [Channa striata]
MIDRARFMALQEDDRVRQFNRMLNNRYVLKENEALVKFHQEEKRIAQEQKRQYDEQIRSRQEEYVKHKKEKARLKQLSNQALAAYRAKQIRENQEIREKHEKDEGERIRRLGGFCRQEELRNQAQRVESRKTDSKYKVEDPSSKNLQKEMEASKLDSKAEKKLQGQFDLEHKIQQKQNERAEKFRNHQLLIENVRDKLANTLKEQATAKARKEEAIISQALAKQDALVSKKQKEEDEKRSAMIKSIAAHRERVIQERKQKDQAERKSNLDWMEAQKEAARRFHQEKAQKAQKARDTAIECRKVNKILIAQQLACAEKLKRDDDEAELRYAKRLAERDEDIEQYIQKELLHLAEKTEGHDFEKDCKESGCSFKDTADYMSSLAHDQMRHIKRYLDCEHPPLSTMTKDPPPLPPLVKKTTVNATAKADYERLQSSLSSPKSEVYSRQEVVHRTVLHRFWEEPKLNKNPLRKLHPLTNFKQQAQEDFSNKILPEESEIMKQERKIIDRARFMALQEDDRVRQFNRMLHNRYVLKENEALIELHQEKKRLVQEQKRQYEEQIRSKQEEYVKQKKEKARLKQLSNQALAAYRAKQIRENQEIREQQMPQVKEVGERIRWRLSDFYAQEELRNQAQRQVESRKIDFKYQMGDPSNKSLQREMEASKLDLKAEKKLRGQFDLEHKIQQKQNERAEKFRNHQLLIENVRDKLVVRLKEQAAAKARKEEEIISRALAKQDALMLKKKKEEEEKRSAMIKSIAAYRERVIQERKQKDQAERKSNLEWMEAQKEAARRFHQEKAQKAQRAREIAIECRKVNDILIAQQRAYAEKLKREEDEAELRNARRLAERDEDIEHYIEKELLDLAEKTESFDFQVDCHEPGCSYEETADYMCSLAHDQMRHIKRYLDYERQPLSMMTTHPPPLPPLVKKTTVNATAKGF